MASRSGIGLRRIDNLKGYRREVQAKLREEMIAARDRLGDRIEEDFRKTYKTWEHKPDFTRKDTVRNGVYKTEVYTDDRIYTFVNDGTSVRYATMTGDFVPKTQPGVLGSGPGRGGVLYVSRQRPRPGIIAREFDLQIVEGIGETGIVTRAGIAINRWLKAINGE